MSHFDVTVETQHRPQPHNLMGRQRQHQPKGDSAHQQTAPNIRAGGAPPEPSKGGSSHSSSTDSLEPQLQPKKYRRVAAQSPAERVVEVDAMSNDGRPLHMLSEGELNIHGSNQAKGVCFCMFLRRGEAFGEEDGHISLHGTLLGTRLDVFGIPWNIAWTIWPPNWAPKRT